MTETEHGEAHAGPSLNLYLIVALALAIFTITSFVVNAMVTNGTLTSVTGFLVILGVAVCKTLLVGTYFMHLLYDWGKLYFMIIPSFILGIMMMMVLLIDIVHNYRA